MTEVQRLFLVQARSDFRIFTVFEKDSAVPRCHALHYLQMATELLGKAYVWRNGPAGMTHRAFVSFLANLASNKAAQSELGYAGKNASWKNLLRKSKPLAEQIEDLAPALAGDGPNLEYPWPPDAPAVAPVEFGFRVWKDFTDTPTGRQLLSLLDELLRPGAAEKYL